MVRDQEEGERKPPEQVLAERYPAYPISRIGIETGTKEGDEAPSREEITADLDIADAEVTLKIVELSRAYEMPVTEVIQIVGESLPPGRTLGEYADELLTEAR